MDQILVAGGIGFFLLVLWWITHRIRSRDRESSRRSAAMQQENSQLRHVVTEMAMEKHRNGADRRGRSD